MTAREHAETLWLNLLSLGPRRLSALALIALTVLGLISGSAYYLSRPQYTVLYTALDNGDASRIGSALNDAGISFDVSADGTTVYVSPNQTAQARMLLAEKGLPRSASAGYELFNELGSLGLTSFMQEVTRVRALEGELARTIQTMKGVKAARVHIVLPDRGSFRRDQQPPSASVIIRTDVPDDVRMAEAIRQLVAGAVPALGVDHITVLDTEGTVLASGEDATTMPGSKANRLERTFASGVEANVRHALSPYLGPDNFQISVAAELNTDRSRVNQTLYDPESRVERSVRTIRESGNSQNTSQQMPATVEQNLPEDTVQSGDLGDKSSEENQRREELTNYEISTTTKETVSDGYSVKSLSIALIVNRARVAQSLGDNPTPEAIDARVKEMGDLAASAAGLNTARGDRIQVTAVDFAEGFANMEPVPPLTLSDVLLRQMGTVVNALAILVVAILLIWFGLRPAMTALLPRLEKQAAEEAEAAALPAGATGEAPAALAGAETPQDGGGMQHLIEDMNARMRNSPLKVLEQLVEMDEEQAATILRQWMKEEEAA